MGRGTGTKHQSSQDAHDIPRVGLDYFFITTEGVKRRDELGFELSEEGEAAIDKARTSGSVVKCLVVRCMESKNVFGHVVPQKGDDEEHYCANLVASDIEWLGHTKSF